MGGVAKSLDDEVGVIRIDDSNWPIMIVTPPLRVSDQQMQDFLVRHRALEHERNEDYVLVLDLRGTGKLTGEQREMMTEGMAKTEDDTPCRALAMIFESQVLRGILSMMFWVRKPPYPTKVFATPEDAFPWVRQTLAERRRVRKESIYLQCDASIDIEKAGETLRVALELGLSGELVTRNTGGRMLSVPRLGPFETRDDALTACEKLEAAGLTARITSS